MVTVGSIWNPNSLEFGVAFDGGYVGGFDDHHAFAAEAGRTYTVMVEFVAESLLDPPRSAPPGVRFATGGGQFFGTERLETFDRVGVDSLIGSAARLTITPRFSQDIVVEPFAPPGTRFYEPYRITVERTDNTVRSDELSGISLDVGTPINSRLDDAGAADWFEIELEADTPYRFSVSADVQGTEEWNRPFFAPRFDFNLYSADYQLITTLDWREENEQERVGTLHGSVFVYTPDEDEVVYAAVTDDRATNSSPVRYQVRVDEAATAPAPPDDAPDRPPRGSAIQLGDIVEGSIDFPADQDWFSTSHRYPGQPFALIVTPRFEVGPEFVPRIAVRTIYPILITADAGSGPDGQGIVVFGSSTPFGVDDVIVTGVEGSVGDYTLSFLSLAGTGLLELPRFQITGTNSADVVTRGATHDLIRGRAGNDDIAAGAGSDFVEAGPGGDFVAAGPSADLLRGGDGNDTLWGGEDDDRLNGGDGDDRLSGGTGSDQLLGGDGNDTLRGMDGADTADGGAGDDLVEGGDGDDFLVGWRGLDTVVGGDGADTLTGGWGDDLLIGGDGADRLLGGRGNDHLQGGPNPAFSYEVLIGGLGDDTLWGGSGSETLLGMEGNDVLVGGSGTSVMDGGPGADIYRIKPHGTLNWIEFDGDDVIDLQHLGLSHDDVAAGLEAAKQGATYVVRFEVTEGVKLNITGAINQLDASDFLV